MNVVLYGKNRYKYENGSFFLGLLSAAVISVVGVRGIR